MSEEVVKAVLSETSDPVSGTTPIAYTAIYNEIDTMEKIVKLGGSLTKQNRENYSALQFAKLPPSFTIFSMVSISLYIAV